jgi:hypothetical protein
MELPYCAPSLIQVPDRVTVLYRPGPFLVLVLGRTRPFFNSGP